MKTDKEDIMNQPLETAFDEFLSFTHDTRRYSIHHFLTHITHTCNLFATIEYA